MSMLAAARPARHGVVLAGALAPILVFLGLLTLPARPARAAPPHAAPAHRPTKPKPEDVLNQEAQKLTYEGQLEKARQLLGDGSEGGFPMPGKKGKGDDDGTTNFVLGLFLGAIGTGYFIYGKKQGRFVFLLCGIGLCTVPMFVSNLATNAILGVLMVVAPFKLEG